MTDQIEANKAAATLRSGELAKQIDALKTIVWVLAIAFSGGVIWDKLLTYQGKVDSEQVQIETLRSELNDRLNDLKRDINSFKVNLGHLSDPSYQIEVSEEGDGGRCEQGNVATGVRYDSKAKKFWIRCASLSRAAWNPEPSISSSEPRGWETQSVTTGAKRQ
jgi:hypothetical protein